MNKAKRKKRSPGSAGLPHRAGSAGSRHRPIPVGPRGPLPHPDLGAGAGAEPRLLPQPAKRGDGGRAVRGAGQAGPPCRTRGGRRWEAVAPPPRAGGQPARERHGLLGAGGAAPRAIKGAAAALRSLTPAPAEGCRRRAEVGPRQHGRRRGAAGGELPACLPQTFLLLPHPR